MQMQPQQPSMQEMQQTMNPQQQPDGSPSPQLDTEDEDGGGDIIATLEEHLNTLPDNQKAFLVEYLTPETAALLGIVNGPEVYEYFQKYVDPNKSVQVINKSQENPDQQIPGNQPSMADAGGSMNPMQQAPQPQASSSPIKL